MKPPLLDVLDDLLELKQRDSGMRARLLQEGRLYGRYDEDMQRVHRDNAHRLDEIVSTFGWPGISRVGLDGCRAAWLIAQHAICTPDLQRKFLVSLTDSADKGDAPKMMVALLTDRIRFNEGRPQVYGTVLDWNAEGELWCDVEDQDNLDARRKEAGLPPFQDDLEKHRREVAAEGGNFPQDFNEYKRKQREWAQQVGWL